MFKKGQLTLETLLWYGAALLVVLLAIAALINFGVLDMGSMLPEKCNFKGSGFLNCDDYKVDINNDEIQLQLTNKGTKSIVINSADFVANDAGLVTDCNQTYGTPVTIQPGKSELLTIDCTAGGSGAVEAEEGVRVTGEVKLDHNIGDGSIDHIAIGELSVRATE